MAVLTLHDLLDATERVVLESFYDKDPKKAEHDRDAFLDALYKPTPEAMKINGDGYKPVPSGFLDGEDDDAFDSAMIALGAE